jgi:hypothetical protein
VAVPRSRSQKGRFAGHCALGAQPTRTTNAPEGCDGPAQPRAPSKGLPDGERRTEGGRDARRKEWGDGCQTHNQAPEASVLHPLGISNTEEKAHRHCTDR